MFNPRQYHLDQHIAQTADRMRNAYSTGVARSRAWEWYVDHKWGDKNPDAMEFWSGVYRRLGGKLDL